MTRDSLLLDCLEVSLVPGIGSLGQSRLWESFPSLSAAFSAGAARLERLGIPDAAASALLSRRYRPMAEEIADWASRHECRILLRGSAAYPPLLEEIHDPPLLLYARGVPEAISGPCVSIVGTRRPTYYGLQMAQGLAADLATRGIRVVSGLARGIDSAAHRGCLEASGITIAVLGCGIDVVYPRENGHLTRQILERGCLLSEFPPGTSPAPQNFPVRNRLISGLSHGTAIIEASEYSGSLITARLAMEQNREVFALPGNITVPQSFGPNYLIRQGARLIQSWRDIAEELPAEHRQAILSLEQCTDRGPRELEVLTPDEDRVLNLIGTDEAVEFDRLYRSSGFDIPRLTDMLLGLEMRGWIRQVPGNLYLRKARPPK